MGSKAAYDLWWKNAVIYRLGVEPSPASRARRERGSGSADGAGCSVPLRASSSAASAGGRRRGPICGAPSRLVEHIT
jgi:hypothetical protein